MRRAVSILTLAVLVGCTASSNPASDLSATSPSPPASSGPTPDTTATLLHVCQTYYDVVTYALRDNRKGTRTDSEIVDQLREYQDSLEEDAHALTDAGYTDAGHATLAMADAIGHFKNAVDSFGLPQYKYVIGPLAIRFIREAAKAGQDLLPAACPALLRGASRQ